jgi:hypothetical protein
MTQGRMDCFASLAMTIYASLENALNPERRQRVGHVIG